MSFGLDIVHTDKKHLLLTCIVFIIFLIFYDFNQEETDQVPSPILDLLRQWGRKRLNCIIKWLTQITLGFITVNRLCVQMGLSQMFQTSTRVVFTVLAREISSNRDASSTCLAPRP